MKTFYRKAFGCFICTDVYTRPWWWRWRAWLPYGLIINDRYKNQ